MSSTYKGDSPGKKITRVRMWSNMMLWANWLDMKNEGILVLAGDGGDLSALDGWGVDHDKITAVDIAKDSVDKCRERFPGVRTMHGSLGKVVKNPNVKYNMAHVDFCGGLSMPNINTLNNVIQNADASQPLILAVTMLKGREYKRAQGKIVCKLPRPMRKRMAAMMRSEDREIAARMMMNGPFHPRDLIELAEQELANGWDMCKDDPDSIMRKDMISRNFVNKDGSISYLGTCYSRQQVLKEILQSMMIQEASVRILKNDNRKRMIAIEDIGLLGYHSRDKNQNGTPFVTMIFVLFNDVIDELVCTELPIFNGRDYITTGVRCFSYWRALSANQGMTAFKAYVAQFAAHAGTEMTAKMFDLPRGTVAAWLAHKNMGTYDSLEKYLKQNHLYLSKPSKQWHVECEEWGRKTGVVPAINGLSRLYSGTREAERKGVDFKVLVHRDEERVKAPSSLFNDLLRHVK